MAPCKASARHLLWGPWSSRPLTRHPGPCPPRAGVRQAHVAVRTVWGPAQGPQPPLGSCLGVEAGLAPLPAGAPWHAGVLMGPARTLSGWSSRGLTGSTSASTHLGPAASCQHSQNPWAQGDLGPVWLALRVVVRGPAPAAHCWAPGLSAASWVTAAALRPPGLSLAPPPPPGLWPLAGRRLFPGVCSCRACSGGCVVGSGSAARVMVTTSPQCPCPAPPSREGRAGLGARLCFPSVRGPYGVSARQDTGPADVPSSLLIGCNRGHRPSGSTADGRTAVIMGPSRPPGAE